MEHEEFYNSLKSGEFARCYVFEGIEEFVKHSALDRLRELILPPGFFDVNELTLIDPDAEKLIAAAETLPLLAEKRMVIVRECGMLSGKVRDYDEAKNAERLFEYVKTLPETVCIVFYVRGKADARKKLYTILKKNAVLVQFNPLDEHKLTSWIAQTLKKVGKRIQPDACAHLIFMAGQDMTRLYGELCKLSAFVGEKETITRSDIDAICIETPEYKVFDMASALLAGEGAKAFKLTQSILRDGEDALFLLALLYRQLKQMQYTRILSDEKYSYDSISSRIGIPVFIVQRVLKQAKAYTIKQLEKMSDLCFDTEYGVKSGKIASEGALEYVMLQILAVQVGGEMTC